MSLNPFHKTPWESLKEPLIHMMKDRESRQHALSVVSIIFLFFAIFVGIFVGLLQKQEIRKQASEDPRKAQLILVPSTTPLRAGTLSTIFVRLDTHGEAVDGVQVVFDLLTDVTDEFSIQVKEGQGLRRAWDKVEGIEGGKKISFAAISNNAYQPFSSTSPIDVAEITFVAKKPGNMAMVFDGFSTKVNRHQQVINILKPIIIQEYKIAVAPPPIIVKKIVSEQQVVSTPDLVTTKGEEKDIPEVVEAQVKITSISSLGICNDTCRSSVECGTNFLCYEQRCRLATNLTSVECQDIAQRSKGCDQDCTQAIECQTGLTCFEGTCRDVSNPQSEVCQSDQTVADNIASLCGTECSLNSDCGDNLSCQDEECRLATNPTSPNCLAKEVVVRQLGSDEEIEPAPLEVLDSEQSLSLLTQVVMALALTVVVGFIGMMIYSVVRRKRNGLEL